MSNEKYKEYWKRFYEAQKMKRPINRRDNLDYLTCKETVTLDFPR